MAMDLNNKHPDYIRTESTRTKARDLYDGSYAVKCKGATYLFPTKNEDETNYKFRKQRAVYDNYAQAVIQSRLSLVWRKLPSRVDFPLELESFFDDIDANGSRINIFMRNVSEYASADGIAFVLVDKTPLPKSDKPLSAQQEKELNIRPFFTLLRGDQVIDWKINSFDHKLDWIVIKQCTLKQSDPGEAASVKEQRVIWFRDRWELWEDVSVANAYKQSFDKIDSQPHPLNEIPIVPFYGLKESNMVGWPITKDILDHIISIYNSNSDIDYSSYLSNNAIPVFATDISREDMATIDVGYGKGVKLNKGDSAFYLEPTGSAISSTRETISQMIRRIYETSLFLNKPTSAQVQSSESLKQESRIFSSSIVSFSIGMEVQEKRCWELFAKWQNVEIGNAEVNYNIDFDDNMITEAMISQFSALVDKRIISKKSFYQILSDGEIIDVDPEEETKQISLETTNSENTASAGVAEATNIE